MMVKNKERWYLYADDLEYSKSSLVQDIYGAPISIERAWLLKHLPSLGEFDEAHNWLIEKEPTLLDTIHGRATLLRLLQHQNVPNPWVAMVPNNQRKAFDDFCNMLANSSAPLDIWLGGGLGDQLECLAQICNPVMHSFWSRLNLVLPMQGRKALEPFLDVYWPHWAPSYQFKSGNPGGKNQGHWLSLMGWLYFLAHQNFDLRSRIVDAREPDTSNSPTFVCCWRSKVDLEDKHWAHLRSFSFVQIEKLYSNLIPWANDRGVQIVDLTLYSNSEKLSLIKYSPSLSLVQPSIQSMSDTASLILSSRGVISVDTSLIHLSNWFAWPSLLLLHLHHDERWNKHSLSVAGGQYFKICRQSWYNNWSDFPLRILQYLSAWPWL